MQLKIELINFRDITAKAIENLKKEKYEELNPLLNKREEIIETLKSQSLDLEQFRTICDEINLIKLECELGELIKNKRNEVKVKLESLSKNIQASNSYNKMEDSPLIFSKKI